MKVLILASLLCMLFAAGHSAPAEVMEVLPEGEPAVSDNAVEGVNQVEPVLFQVEAAEDPEVQSALAAVDPVDMTEEEQAIPDPLMFCPSGWLSLGSGCYKHFPSSMSWSNAEKHCETFNSHLAGAETYQDYNTVRAVAQFSGYGDIWIGGFYFQSSWRWIDGSHFDYTNWYSHSPGSSYPCIYQHRAGWVSSNCASARTFICVRKAC
ncbi:ladderlectin-like isoform X2 [Engraulis encrasicolus]|uniref:ladderlectin-like isoform X2 n=1 Tax=Engraulis encrasicolus TaxID=184585 RepID=UPI002FD1FD61